MSESSHLEELFPGSNEELTACRGWLNRTSGQLATLLRRLDYFLSEREHAPLSANSAMQSCQQSASLVFDRLAKFPELDCLSSIVHEQLCEAVFPMLSALQKIRDANSGETFDEAIDYFLAVGKRFQSESKIALRGCVLTMAARERRRPLPQTTTQTNLTEAGDEAGGPPKKPSGRTVTEQEHKNRKLVFERYQSFKRDCEEAGKRPFYKDAAKWMTDKYNDMDFLTKGLFDPTDYTAIGERIKAKRRAHQRTPEPRRIK